MPSLWNKFLWPWYDQREEKSLGSGYFAGTGYGNIFDTNFVFYRHKNLDYFGEKTKNKF